MLSSTYSEFLKIFIVLTFEIIFEGPLFALKMLVKEVRHTCDL